MKMTESYLNGQKTLWEKEKLLVTSNFSFSHSVSGDLNNRPVKTRACLGRVKCLPNAKIVESNLNVAVMVEFVFDRIRNIVGK